jgi:hypothetical protein
MLSFKLIICVSEFKFKNVEKFNYHKVNVLTIMKNWFFILRKNVYVYSV